MLIKMCKENSYAKMEKLGTQICRCTRQGLKVIPWSWGIVEENDDIEVPTPFVAVFLGIGDELIDTPWVTHADE